MQMALEIRHSLAFVFPLSEKKAATFQLRSYAALSKFNNLIHLKANEKLTKHSSIDCRSINDKSSSPGGLFPLLYLRVGFFSLSPKPGILLSVNLPSRKTGWAAGFGAEVGAVLLPGGELASRPSGRDLWLLFLLQCFNCWARKSPRGWNKTSVRFPLSPSGELASPVCSEGRVLGERPLVWNGLFCYGHLATALNFKPILGV